MALNLPNLPVILDRTVKQQGDRFGHKDYADALSLLIRNPQNLPPFSIGLLGSWGTGKSSIEEMTIENLQSDDRFKIIQFNAWRYGGENIKRALLREVFLALSDQKTGEEELQKLIKAEYTYSNIQDSNTWKDLIPVLKRAGALLVVVMLLSLAVMLLWAIAARWNGIQIAASYSPPHTAPTYGSEFVGLLSNFPNITLLGLGALGIAVFTHFRFMLPPYRTVTEKRTAKSLEETIESSLEVLIRKRLEAKFRRIVVFVDDLDRLSADEMVSGLDAIRNFMDIRVENQASSALPAGIVFIISCDEERIAEALEKRRHRTSDLPAVVLNAQDARRFLDRVFQYRLEIPPFPKQDMRAFIQQKLDVPAAEGGLQDLYSSLIEAKVQPGYIVERLIQYDVTNPRAALQMINAFTQSWWVAVRREAFDQDNRSGALNTGVVTQHAEVLAVICALRVLHPTFYQDLQQSPQLLQNFISVFIDQDPEVSEQHWAALPPRDRQVLKKYLSKSALESVQGDESPKVITLDEKFSPLLDSIAWRKTSLHLPEDLEPLLLLSQDLESRRSPHSVRVLEKALNSREGFLQALNIQGDARLTNGDLRQIRRLIDERLSQGVMGVLNQRQGYKTLTSTQILEKLPTDTSSVHEFSNPLAQGLTSQRELRFFVGPMQTIQIAKLATQNYQQGLLSVLTEELLSDSDQPLSFLDDSGQPLKPDIAYGAIEELVPLLMDGNLSSQTQTRFFNWLNNLNIGKVDEDQTFPLGESIEIHTLRSWYQQRPTFFRGQPGRAYAQHATQALIKDTLDNKLVEPLLSDLEPIWTSEHALGGEYAQAVLHQMSRLLRLEDTEIVQRTLQRWDSLEPSFSHSERRNLVQALAAHVAATAEELTDDERLLRTIFVNKLQIEDLYTGADHGQVSSSAVVPVLKRWGLKAADPEALDRLVLHCRQHRPGDLQKTALTWLSEAEQENTSPEALKLIGQSLDVLGDKVAAAASAMVKNALQSNSSTALKRSDALLSSASPNVIRQHFKDVAEWFFPHISTTYLAANNNFYNSSPMQPSVVSSLLHMIRLLAPGAPVQINNLLVHIAQTQGAGNTLFDDLLAQLEINWHTTFTDETISVLMAQGVARVSAVPTMAGLLVGGLISLSQQFENTVLHQQALKELNTLGAKVWPHDKAAAMRLLVATKTETQTQTLAQLVTGINVDDQAQQQNLFEAWQQLMPALSQADQLQILSSLLNQRPRVNNQMVNLIIGLLKGAPNAATLAAASISSTTGEDLDDLWQAALEKPGNIGSAWLKDQVALLLFRPDAVKTLRTHESKLLSRLDEPAKLSLLTIFRQQGFNQDVPDSTTRLAADWMSRIDAQALRSLNDFPRAVRDRVRQIRSELKSIADK